MLSAIYNLLPFQSQSSHSYPDATPACHGYLHPFPSSRPSVRLYLVSGQSSCLYGYLPYARGDPDPGYLFIDDPPLTTLDYVSGSDWRTRVEEPPGSSTIATSGMIDSQRSNESYIPRTDGDDEAEHCLRMKRCGALWADPTTSFMERRDMPVQAAENQIFGWPSQKAGGGVWVLRIPKIWRRPFPFDMDAMMKQMQEEERHGDQMKSLKERLKKQDDMDSACEVLRDAGAVHYERIEECPEVVELDLLRLESGTDALVQSDGSHSPWK